MKKVKELIEPLVSSITFVSGFITSFIKDFGPVALAIIIETVFTVD